MKIGGFQKNSLIDFPGTISCVVFTNGCNFHCPYCHNPNLVKGIDNTSSMNQDEILDFIDRRKGMLSGVVITGGEPTLQHDLIDFIKIVKQMGYKVKLDTNGTSPKVLVDLFDQDLVDYVAMDIKTDIINYHTVMNNPEQLGGVIRSTELIMTRAPKYEFRTTCVKPFTTTDRIRDIGRLINGAELYILQSCSFDNGILDSDFAKDKGRLLDSSYMSVLRETILPFVPNTKVR